MYLLQSINMFQTLRNARYAEETIIERELNELD